MSIQQVIRELKKDAARPTDVPAEASLLSGGEPLMQYEFASELLQACKGQGWNTHRSRPLGVGSREAIEKVIPYVDTVLLDIERLDGERHEDRRVSNDLVIRNAHEICKISNTVIRVPVIPGFNYSVEDTKAIAELRAEP